MTDEIIKLKHVNVTFNQENREVSAVKDVSLSVKKGEVYGIVGYSGAGKSTLVRTINLLQRPTSGEIIVNGQDMLSLRGKRLREARTKIGMIFQHFNLMNERTIASNVEFALIHSKLSKSEKQKKVDSLLNLVGLADKKEAYPSQLSGGQKQRVAIARALANEPDVLISDEATSALDPKTTVSILKLLKKLNQQLGLTIVLITHEMDAVKEVCQNVAVMSQGEIIERGSLLDIFSNPQKQLTRDIVNTASKVNENIQTILEQPEIQNMPADTELVKLTYTGMMTGAPLIIELYKRFKVTANILFGNIEHLQNTPFGNLVVTLQGDQKALKQAFSYLSSRKVRVEVVKGPANTQIKEVVDQ